MGFSPRGPPRLDSRADMPPAPFDPRPSRVWCLPAGVASRALTTPDGEARIRPRRGRVRFAGIAAVLAVVAALGLNAPDSADAAGMPYVVNDTRDMSDSNPGDGFCRSGWTGDSCSLRAAIQEANASFGPDFIQVLPGTYELEIPTVNDDLPETGDLDVHDSVTIYGESAGTTIIDGGTPPSNEPEAALLAPLV